MYLDGASSGSGLPTYQGIFIVPAGQSIPPTLTLAESWAIAGGLYLFVDQAPSNEVTFVAAVRDYVAAPGRQAVRLLWLADPNAPLAAWSPAALTVDASGPSARSHRSCFATTPRPRRRVQRRQRHGSRRDRHRRGAERSDRSRVVSPAAVWRGALSAGTTVTIPFRTLAWARCCSRSPSPRPRTRRDVGPRSARRGIALLLRPRRRATCAHSVTGRCQSRRRIRSNRILGRSIPTSARARASRSTRRRRRQSIRTSRAGWDCR